jgi:hypothetical protein
VYLLVVQGYRYKDESSGVWIALTGLALVTLSLLYSMAIWLIEYKGEQGYRYERISQKFGILFTLMNLAPSAYYFDSIPLGYLTIALLYVGMAQLRCLNPIVNWFGWSGD